MIRLEELRLSAPLSREELSRETGVSYGTIRGLETGEIKRPQIKTLRALAEHFAVPITELLLDVVVPDERQAA